MVKPNKTTGPFSLPTSDLEICVNCGQPARCSELERDPESDSLCDPCREAKKQAETALTITLGGVTWEYGETTERQEYIPNWVSELAFEIEAARNKLLAAVRR